MMNEWTPLFIPTHVNFYASAFRRRRHYVFGLSVRPSVRSLKCPLLTCTWVRWSTRPTVTVLRHVRPSVRPSVCPSVCRLTFRVRPVASTVLDGFFPYLVQMINSMRGCVACDDPWPWAISSRSFGLDLEHGSHRPWKVLEFECCLEKCLIFQSSLKMGNFPWKVLENDFMVLKNISTRKSNLLVSYFARLNWEK